MLAPPEFEWRALDLFGHSKMFTQNKKGKSNPVKRGMKKCLCLLVDLMRMRSTRTCGKCVRSCEHLWALCLCVYPEPTNLLFTFSFSLHAPAKLISPSPSGRLFKQANKIRLLLFLEAKDLYAQKPTFPVLAYGLKPFSRPFKVQVHRFSWSFGKPSILLVSTHSFPMMAN